MDVITNSKLICPNQKIVLYNNIEVLKNIYIIIIGCCCTKGQNTVNLNADAVCVYDVWLMFSMAVDLHDAMMSVIHLTPHTHI